MESLWSILTDCRMQRCCILYYSISTVLESIPPFPRITVLKVCKSQLLWMGVESQGLCMWTIHSSSFSDCRCSQSMASYKELQVYLGSPSCYICNAQLSKVNKVKITNFLCQVFIFNCSFRNKCKIFGKLDNLLTSANSSPRGSILETLFLPE